MRYSHACSDPKKPDCIPSDENEIEQPQKCYIWYFDISKSLSAYQKRFSSFLLYLPVKEDSTKCGSKVELV